MHCLNFTEAILCIISYSHFCSGPLLSWIFYNTIIPYALPLFILDLSIPIVIVLFVYHLKCELLKSSHTCSRWSWGELRGGRTTSWKKMSNITTLFAPWRKLWYNMTIASPFTVQCYWSRHSKVLKGKLTNSGQAVKSHHFNTKRMTVSVWTKQIASAAVLRFLLWEKKRKLISFLQLN